MLDGGETLGDHRVRTVRVRNGCRKVVAAVGIEICSGIGLVAPCNHRGRLSGTFEVPASDVEKMNGFLQCPVADANGVEPPSVRSGAVRPSPEIHEDITRFTHDTFVDQAL